MPDNKYYGWRPDTPDKRDIYYRVARAVPIPEKVDLSREMPPCYDQGNLGSCTGNMAAGAIHHRFLKSHQNVGIPSRLFIYYLERELEGTVASDAGAEIRDAIKVVNHWGVPPEWQWAYDIRKFAQKPPAKAFRGAIKNLVTQYERIADGDLNAMKVALSQGYTICFGFSVYESFESNEVASSGVVNMPLRGEKMVGGHAVLAIGYDETQERFLVRNSWGTDWGKKGNFTMPYEYLHDPDLSADFWVIKFVT